MIDVAIIGSGAAGLGALHSLDASAVDCRFTVYENSDHLGGHANTITIHEADREFPLDTGFMVFNKVTYPKLVELFEKLKVPETSTDMSFSVQQKVSGLEYAGASWKRLFGQRSNIFNLRFWKFLLQLDRFNREAVLNLNDAKFARVTLKEYVRLHNYGDDFLNLYIIPMAGSVWSTPAERMLQFPAATLLRFFYNHGFLGMDTQHQWWTVQGGSKVYIEKLFASLKSKVDFTGGALKVSQEGDGLSITGTDGLKRNFGRVIVACHADDAARLIEDCDPDARSLLSAFEYQENDTCVHTDSSVMPMSKNCWSSWNYRIDAAGGSTHYWMNSLQHLPTKTNYFVSLNARNLIDPKSIVRQMTYHHPLFSLAAVDAQNGLKALNEQPGRNLFFCGSYMRYGFHEDAFASGCDAASQLLGGVHARQHLSV